MSCVKYREEINLFVDGETDARHQVELFRHLADCPDCQAYVDAAVRTKEACRSERIPYPSDLDDRILAGILTTLSLRRRPVEEGHERKMWNQRITLSLPIAASFAFIIIALGLLFGRLTAPRFEPLQNYEGVRAGQGQFPPVILVYGIPPVEVLGTPAVKTLEGHKHQNNEQ